jgi:hypothetical protein
MIGYTTIGTNDLGRAMSFYDALFRNLGISRLMELPSFAAWGTGWDKPMFGVCLPYDGEEAKPGNGTMIALALETRDLVRVAHARTLELGGTSEGAPGLRGAEGSQAFFASYVRDHDGNKLCFYCIGPETEKAEARLHAVAD